MRERLLVLPFSFRHPVSSGRQPRPVDRWSLVRMLVAFEKGRAECARTTKGTISMRHPILLALAFLGLAGCSVSVHDNPAPAPSSTTYVTPAPVAVVAPAPATTTTTVVHTP
jgi:hypothetical protein